MPDDTNQIPSPEPVTETPPPTPPTPIVEPTITPTVVPKKKNKRLIIGIIIAVAAVILLGGTALAYQFWYQNPEKVVTDSMQSIFEAKSVASKGSLVYTGDQTSVTVQFDSNTAQTGAADINVTATIKSADTSYDVKGAGLVDKDGNVYFKLNDVAASVKRLTEQYGSSINTAPYDALIAKIDGRWIRVSADDLSDISKDTGKTQTCVTDAFKSFNDDSKVRKEVTDLYSAHRFVVIGNSLGSKSIGGVDSIGYAVTLDDAIFKDFYKGLGDTQIGKKLAGCSDSVNFSDTKDVSVKDTDGSTTDIKVWASRFGHQLTEVDLKGTNKDKTSTQLVWDPTFNKAVTVETPTDFITIKDLISDIQTASQNL